MRLYPFSPARICIGPTLRIHICLRHRNPAKGKGWVEYTRDWKSELLNCSRDPSGSLVGGGRVHAWEGGWGTGMLQFEIAFSLFYIWASWRRKCLKTFNLIQSSHFTNKQKNWRDGPGWCLMTHCNFEKHPHKGTVNYTVTHMRKIIDVPETPHLHVVQPVSEHIS